MDSLDQKAFDQASAIDLYRSLVMLDGDEAYTTSLRIAARFNRTHANVLKSIDRILRAIKSRKSCFTREIFKGRCYTDSRGKVQRQFLISKDGFVLLAMRFDGEAALDWQLNFIAAFNWLVEQLRERAENARLIASFEIKERQSIEAGSYHGTGLQLRKVEKRDLATEEAELRAKVQATLLLDGAPPALLN